MGETRTFPAKVTRPRHRGVFPRERLFSRLEGNPSLPACWISGPGGAGKTTLISSYCDRYKPGCLWYRVDSGDDDPASFFYYLGLAAEAAAASEQAALPLLTPEYLLGLSEFARMFFEKLFGCLRAPSLVVLDDCHEVPDASALHGLIVEGFNRLPEGVRLVIASRRGPPPAYGRLVANGQMEVLQAEDLRLSAPETAGIFSLRRGAPPSDETLFLLHERTDGWAAGLILMIEGATFERGRPKEMAAVSPDHIFNYFAGEIFDKAGAELQQFLLDTALLPMMTPAMAESLTGNASAGRLLSALSRNNLFTDRYPGTPPRYRYHPLLREYLSAALERKLTEEEVRQLKRKAARSLAEGGDVEAAARLLAEVEDWEERLGLVLQIAPDLAAQGRNQTLAAMIGAFPADFRDRDPWLAFWSGVALTAQNPPQALSSFSRAHAMFKAAGDPTGTFLSWSGAVQMIEFTFDLLVDVDPWIAELEETYPRLEKSVPREVAARVVDAAFGALVWRRPYPDEIGPWEERAREIFHSDAAAEIRMKVGGHLMMYQIFVGNMSQARLYAEALEAPLAEKSSPSFATLFAHFMQAHCRFYSGLIDECQYHIGKGLEISGETGIRIIDGYLASAGVKAALAKGDTAAAGELLERLRLSAPPERRSYYALYLYVASWAAYAAGNHAQATEFVQRSSDLVRSSGMPVPLAINLVGLAMISIDGRNHARADGCIAEARDIGRNMKSLLIESMCLYAEAHSALRRGRERDAVRLTGGLLAIGRTTGLMGFPWWRNDVMSELLARALAADVETEFATRLIRRRKLVPPASADAAEAWPWPIRIYTMGRFEVRLDGEPLRLGRAGQRKPLELLKALIALGGREVRTERLSDVLWPDADGDTAQQAFDTTLHRLRRILGAKDDLVVEGGMLSLNPRRCWIDLWRWMEVRAQVEKAWSQEGQPKGKVRESVACAERAVAFYEGGFLVNDDGPEPVVGTRERLRGQFLDIVLRLGEHYESAGRLRKASAAYRNGLERENDLVPLYVGLMRCYGELGRASAAMEVYRRCRSLISARQDFGASVELERLRRRLSGEGSDL